MNDRLFIWLAQAFYAISGIVTLYRLRRSNPSPPTSPLNYGTMLAGFVCHTLFLYYRGQAEHRCPITNSFETTTFIVWAAVLFYLMIGPAYRVSFLGAFTAPVALIIGVIALLGLDDGPHRVPETRSPWVEFHASIAIVAFGAFALGFVAGIMYLVQERQLKSRKLSSSFLLLPSIEQLDVISYRLNLLGFVMLSVGMVGGIISYRIIGHWPAAKIAWSFVTWVAYAGVIGARVIWSQRGRRSIELSMLLFVLVLVTYWGVGFYRGTP